MKLHTIFSVTLACVLFAGCIADSEKTVDDGDSGDNSTVNAYLPLPMNGIATVWRTQKTFPADQASCSTYTETSRGRLPGTETMYIRSRARRIPRIPVKCISG